MTENLVAPARPYETLGRFLSLLLEQTSAASATTVTGLHIWEKYGGGCVVEWTAGPHAMQVLRELEMLADDDATTTRLSPGDITDVDEYCPGAVKFRVRGVQFELRPVDTVGVEAEREQLRNLIRECRDIRR
ncbi:hypothetical protein [Pseudonocardia sp. MH-G8]|uniref:hypothetical protein n=1 Tax=Pseudonocardia sp. MH-G8 TaxID=1854588 RepID=UPI001179FDB8|nr:hypothetical protein [Pseudonocardia sp. MH-G8]